MEGQTEVVGEDSPQGPWRSSGAEGYGELGRSSQKAQSSGPDRTRARGGRRDLPKDGQALGTRKEKIPSPDSQVNLLGK